MSVLRVTKLRNLIFSRFFSHLRRCAVGTQKSELSTLVKAESIIVEIRGLRSEKHFQSCFVCNMKIAFPWHYVKAAYGDSRKASMMVHRLIRHYHLLTKKDRWFAWWRSTWISISLQMCRQAFLICLAGENCGSQGTYFGVKRNWIAKWEGKLF